MGASASQMTDVNYMTCDNKDVIRENITQCAEVWGSKVGISQTELFTNIMHTRLEDFTGTFNDEGLDSVFTNKEKCHPHIKYGNYNNCHLFRDSQTNAVQIPLRSNGVYDSLTPLGEPGRDLPDEWGVNISHFMTLKSQKMEKGGPWTFNDLLPSNSEELEDFKERVKFAKETMLSLKNNSPISECGEKVLSVATRLGLPETTPIRDYLAKAIVGLPEEVKTKAPGFVLHDASRNEVSTDIDSVKSLIYEVFNNSELKVFSAIQPPHMNSQILAHLHTCLVPCMCEELAKVYYDANAIIELKENSAEVESDDSEGGLSRTVTNAQ